MPDLGSWNALAGANSSPLILCVGFPVTRHREPGFAELAKKIGLKYRFMQAGLPAARPGQRVSASAYVNQWIDELRDRPIVAVLGYHVGSVYAAAITEALSRRQHTPRVILLDPQPADTWLLSHELHMEINSISSLLSNREIERARKLSAEIAESGSDVASAATTTAEFYWEISSTAFDRVGIGGSYCSKSFAPFESYISLISAASQIDPSSVWKCSTALLSSDYAADLPGRTFLAEESSIQFDVPHTDLLRSDSVAKTILNLLELH